MTIDHAKEASRLLSQASYRASDQSGARFADPETAAILASMAQAHATLAHLPQQQVDAQEQLHRLLSVVVEHAVKLATHWQPELRQASGEFMRDLDGAGVEIDRLVDERSERTGHGPRLCDMFGKRYDLMKQWLDRNGKRWEHTGGWSDVGGPIMRRDEPNGDAMVLSELIREYGPINTAAAPPMAPVVEPEDPPF
ncbi:phiSA1p31-related protein [Kitasatospora sp. NPDC048545]|uniref:phiSA1p31-related protein n=1 Tax=Kitasatospora sp. NPDC048545 TaxID=3157208 RepID=UPI0034018105